MEIPKFITAADATRVSVEIAEEKFAVWLKQDWVQQAISDAFLIIEKNIKNGKRSASIIDPNMLMEGENERYFFKYFKELGYAVSVELTLHVEW